MKTNQNTPGYNSKITVRISADKNGRPMAHYWSLMARRWIGMNLDEGRLLIATETARNHTA